MTLDCAALANLAFVPLTLVDSLTAIHGIPI
jgi:hypothetical protein